jgi:cobalt-zinc-cadmium efflux system outer membrane protein
VLVTTRENLEYYERVLNVNAERLRAGDLARVDMDRLELQRAQFETDVRTAEVNVRTAKIQLLGLLNDRTPVDQFDVTGPFEFHEVVLPLSDLHDAALASRPDLKASAQAVEKAKTDYRLAVANSTTDPTFAAWYSHNPSFNNPFANNTLGGSIAIPLRIFDKNQGERARTQIDIRRSERLEEAAQAQVFADVDSAWVTLNSTAAQLQMYASKYLQLAVRVRETISFSYERGNSSLLEFMQAQNDYRNVQLTYLNLVGAYLTAANQLNMAVGREVIA